MIIDKDEHDFMVSIPMLTKQTTKMKQIAANLDDDYINAKARVDQLK